MTTTPPAPTMPKASRAPKANPKEANPSHKSKGSTGVAKPAPSPKKRQGVDKHKSLAPDKKRTRKVVAASVGPLEQERIVAAKASTTVRQPVAMPTLHDCYLHTHLKKLSRRAQLRRAGTDTLGLLHRHTTLRVFDEICRACKAIVKYQRKKTITKAVLLQACNALGLAIAH
jgi:hypothetical protein